MRDLNYPYLLVLFGPPFVCGLFGTFAFSRVMRYFGYDPMGSLDRRGWFLFLTLFVPWVIVSVFWASTYVLTTHWSAEWIDNPLALIPFIMLLGAVACAFGSWVYVTILLLSRWVVKHNNISA